MISIFCDGACSGNPGPGGWGAIVVADGKVRELGGRAAHTTNNQMELTAAIEALRVVADDPGPVALYTDSVYVIRGITQWIWGWRKRGWTVASGGEVQNRALWEALSQVSGARGKVGAISWRYVRGHVGIPGNERVDEIAVAFSQGRTPTLFRGERRDYFVDIEQLPADTEVPDSKTKGTSSAKSGKPVYLSLLGRSVMRHATWSDCERRVKGQSGAKFKKCLSAAEEAAVLRGWGIDPDSMD